MSTRALDEAVSACAATALPAGDAVVCWLNLAGVRSVNGGGYVLYHLSDDQPPVWQLRGLLVEALAAIDAAEAEAATEQDGDHG